MNYAYILLSLLLVSDSDEETPAMSTSVSSSETHTKVGFLFEARLFFFTGALDLKIEIDV